MQKKVTTLLQELKSFQEDFNYLYSRFTTVSKS